MASTAEEQLLLELVNDARLNPLGDAARYISAYTPNLTSPDASTQSALTYFQVNGATLLQQFQALTPAQPLAWNDKLQTSATNHSQAMIDAGTQSHQVPGEQDLGTRVTAAGYAWQALGENIFAYGANVLNSHAAFMVDWTASPANGGIQSPPGHRNNIMSTGFREIGIGIIDSSANGLGPLVVTQDFGSQGASGVFILGVAYNDTDHNNFYSVGEGLAGLTIAVGATNTTSTASGGYSMQTSATGAQTITLSGAGLATSVQVAATFAGGSNYKVDVIDGHILHTSISGIVSGGVDTVVGLGLTGLSLTTGAGSQTLVGTPGADTLNGGFGRDTAAYTAARSAYTISRAGNVVTVSGPDGADQLTSIETLKFSNATVSLTTNRSDFNANGHSDILQRNGSGVTYLWTMNGATVASGATTSVQVGTNWQIKGVADFNGDGMADILWAYNNASNASDPLNGVSYVSFQSGASALGGGVVQQLSNVWQVAGAGDFNGDGMADVLYRNSSTGQAYLDIMNGSSVTWASSGFTSSQVTDPNWHVAAVADFNGDGDADVLWRYNNASNASDALNGTLYEWRMNGATVTSAGLLSQQAGKNWQAAGTGDFNGDGNADILFRYENASNAADTLNGFTYVDFMNGANVTSGAPTQWQVDNSWAIASIGDYNGDGMSDILLQQTATGKTYEWQMNGANVTSGAFTSQQAGTGWTAQNGVLIG